MANKKQFPKNFSWGAATAAFQIEGHPDEYSQKLSDWSVWMDEPGKVLEPSNKGKAIDHYNHMPEDISFLKDMNCNSYRFSFNWAAMHRAPGDFDEKTIDFYKRLLDELEKNDIEPFATLIHFVVPQWLAKDGGWENPKTAFAFEEFTKKLASEFGSRINKWITHNEANIYLHFGYESGIWPPGYENDWDRYFKAYQGILLGHQLAYKVIKEANPKAQVGPAHNMYAVQSFSSASELIEKSYNKDLPERIEILKAAMAKQDFSHSDIMPTVFRAHIHNFSFVQDCKDMGCLDFLGINYYTRLAYDFSTEAVDLIKPGGKSDLLGQMIDLKKEYPEKVRVNDLNWELYPEGLYQVVSDKRLKRIIGDAPIYITENGYCNVEGACPDAGYSQFADTKNAVEKDSDIEDSYRSDFIKEHLSALHKAIEDGANVQGYFYWSLLDNFEWAMGMRPRFGLVHVDHKSFKRTVKASSKFYGSVCKENSLF